MWRGRHWRFSPRMVENRPVATPAKSKTGGDGMLAGVALLLGGAAVARLFARYRARIAEDTGRIGALASELTSTEQQLETILATVDAAIMVRDVEGRLVYANQAAADLLRMEDIDALLSATAGELMGRFDVYTEDGRPVELADLPGSRVLRGEPNPPAVLVRNVVRETGEERWLLNKATPVGGADGTPLMAVNLIEDISETKRAEVAERLLAEIGRHGPEIDGAAEMLQAVADAAVPALADWACVDVLGPDGETTPVAISHRDPEMVETGWRLRREWPVDPSEPAGLAAVLRTGEAQLVANIGEGRLAAMSRDAEHLEALRRIGLNSAMIVPLVAGSLVVGAMSFASSTSRRFDERDLDLASDLGRQAGLALRNAQLGEERARIAHALQAGLLPDSMPEVDGWDVAGVYRAAGELNEVGGDFYDVVPFDGGWAVMIGDVVGKGAEAAAITALARHTVAAMIEASGDAAAALRLLNRRLRRRADRLPTLVSMAVVVVTPGDELTVVTAGHPLPLLSRGGDVSPVGRTGLLLGVQDEIAVRPTTVRVVPGDRLLLYTDGVVDAVGRGGRFGERRLARTLGDVDPSEPAGDAARVMAAIDAFATGEQADDIAILSLARGFGAESSRAA